MSGVNLNVLLGGLLTITWQQVVMVAIGGILMYLAIVKKYEPTLLLPIGFGCLLGNLPVSAYMIGPEGLFGVLKRAGIETELFPLLIFLGVGAMMDMRPLLSQPVFILMGALGHLGIFA
ncbi:MAG TPA: glutaconyl-CoA decarboxylase subunit beta, partial [Anaerolineae bacterium]|nr:glutaconyl-CoA decarboxylase subunit beta [Anaerolineae bacterium]